MGWTWDFEGAESWWPSVQAHRRRLMHSMHEHGMRWRWREERSLRTPEWALKRALAYVEGRKRGGGPR